ncbi:LLM class oxidoreductase [Stenotrophomonas rhizophila]|uniref:LLM class oxidoreductase n=1 Tax=Stenotrophomonas rhizophila TaxID=216778 RepID=UPI001E2B0343|nr:LLM class oxidoreductase [Stenotrophomonas rhizophila]MCC7632924.1 LLM class oxidoreductase [Stenotrophomonas rhizophila]MCC7662351.1 LLM class oxidoreductase [Stenotrophomonas rhizophila]
MDRERATGASADAFAGHPGYTRMFAPGRLTLGMFLPLRFYRGDMRVLQGQTALVQQIDRHGFAAVWARDVPLYDPAFGDAGQLFDPFTQLAWLAAHTRQVALATGSAIFTLRHPIDLAKNAASIDQLSGGRLVLGIASGDRPVEFPAYGIDLEQRGHRFATAVHDVRTLLAPGRQPLHSALTTLHAAELLPKPATGRIPLIVTGSSRQSLDWIAEHADGWLTYPHATHHDDGPRQLAARIADWRARLPDPGFRPHMTNEWIDLHPDRHYPRTPIDGGYALRTGRTGLLDLLGQWQAAGVNHAALGIQFSQRPAAEVIQELAEEVLPHFPSLAGTPPLPQHW